MSAHCLVVSMLDRLTSDTFNSVCFVSEIAWKPRFMRSNCIYPSFLQSPRTSQELGPCYLSQKVQSLPSTAPRKKAFITRD